MVGWLLSTGSSLERRINVFFKTLKKAFKWTDKCQKALEELKEYLASPPLLNPSKPDEELSLYLVMSPTVVSSALIREEDRVQLPIYYTNWVLREAEGRYAPMEKLVFALITATRKLKPYFQAHTIVVQTDKPLQKAINNLEAARWLVLWAIKLGEFDVQYRPRTTIKAQALAYFITEFTMKENEEERPAAWMI